MFCDLTALSITNIYFIYLLLPIFYGLFLFFDCFYPGSVWTLLNGTRIWVDRYGSRVCVCVIVTGWGWAHEECGWGGGGGEEGGGGWVRAM